MYKKRAFVKKYSLTTFIIIIFVQCLFINEQQEFSAFSTKQNNMFSPHVSSIAGQSGILKNGPKLSPIQEIAVNPETNKVYATSSEAHAVYVINEITNTVKSVPIKNANHIAIDPQMNLIYITDFIDDLVSVIDGTTDNVKTTFNILGAGSSQIAVNPRTHILYITGLDESKKNNIVNVINENKITNPLEKRNITIGERTNYIASLAINPKTNMTYVGQYNEISVINSSNALVANITIPGVSKSASVSKISVNNNTNLAYVINDQGNRIFVINGSTNKIIRTIIGNYTISGQLISTIAVDPITNLIYFASAGSPTVSVIDGNSNVITTVVHVRNYPITGLSINAKTHMIYLVTSSGSLSVMNGNKDAILATNISNQLGFLLPGIKINKNPIRIVVNPTTNRLYVTYTDSTTISVIDISSDNNLDNIISTINLDGPRPPSSIAVNPKTNKIYATTSGLISVIDGSTNKTANKFTVGGNTSELGDIVIDSNRNVLFVNDLPSKKFFTIDAFTNVPEGESENGSAFAIDPVAGSVLGDRLSVNNNVNNNVITIPVDRPGQIAVNPVTSLAYVASDYLYVLDLFTHSIIKKIRMFDPLSLAKYTVAVNPTTNMIYVSDSSSDVVTVINGTTNSIQANVTVGRSPVDLAVNPNTNTIYVANRESNTISVIDGRTDNLTAKLNFNTNPPNAGIIYCNNQKITNNFGIYSVDTALQCKAKSNNGYTFSSWSGDLVPTYSNILNITSSRAYNPIWFGNQIYDSLSNFFSFRNPTSDLNDLPAVNFIVSKYGNLNANFVQSTQVSIPPEFWTPLYGLFLGFFIPSIISWINGKRQRRHLRQSREKIDKIYQKYKSTKDKGEFLKSLDKIQIQLTQGFERGKISESHYRMLKERISEYVKETDKAPT